MPLLPIDHILALNDAGRTPAQIVAETGLQMGPVYAVLREHRPERKRAPRTRTSHLPGYVMALDGEGVGAARIAALLGVSRAYVYQILQKGQK